MKINVTATGNIIFGGKRDIGGGAYRAQYNDLCSDGVISTITLSGNTLAAYNGNPVDFYHIQRDLSVFYYPAGSNEPTSVQEISETSTTYPLPPGLDSSFNLTVPLPSGVDIGFQITLQVCEWDPGHATISCKILNYDAVTIDHFSGPDLCFQVEQITPADQSKNVDFDQPVITTAFTTPFDPDSINADTLAVFYWDEDGNKAYVDGAYEFSDDKKVVTFNPSGGLLDGVYYVAEVWGENDAKATGRSSWVKGANGGPLKTGKTWSFWTMPDLTDKITVVPVQSVEGTALIKDKPTVLRVFMRWDAKPQVSPDWQLKTLDANIKVSWWENSTGQFDEWGLTGQGTGWTPKFGTPLKREYLIFTTPDESYSKLDKMWGRESVNYFGYTPRNKGALSVKAEVEPLGQNTVKSRTFVSTEASAIIQDSKKFRYAFIPLNVGNWTGTGMVTTCPPGISGPCVNIQEMADRNHVFMRSLFPLSPGHAVRNRNLTQFSLITPPASLGPFHPTSGTNANLANLLYWLSRRAQASNTWDVLVGVVPRDWLGNCGLTYPEYTLIGLDFARNSILMGQNVPEEILAHEMGHILRDWDDYGPGVQAGEGFQVDRKRPWSNNAFSMAGRPFTDPIRNLMYRDVCQPGLYWLDQDHYIQLYQNELAPLSAASLQAGEPLLLASGAINLNTNVVTRDPWYILESGSWKAPSPGEFDLVLVDAGGTVLGSHSFAAMAPVDGLSRFLLKVPYSPGTARIQIKRQSALIQEIFPSSQEPQLSIISPTPGQTWSGTRTVTWTASDGNSDPLYFTLYLSSNGGADWTPLEMDLQTNSYTLDTRTIASSADCFLKIAASDGLLTTIRTVGPFTIQNPSQVAGFSPQAGETGAAVNGPIRIEFSEGINPATLTAGTFYLRDAHNQAVPGTIAYDAPTGQAVLTPDSPLNYATSYTVHATNGVLTSGGTPPEGLPLTWSFTTEANTYPPQIIRFSPNAGADKVSLNAALVTVRFDKPLNPASLGPASFLVTAKNGSAVTGQISYNADTQTALFRPSDNLTANSQYTVTLTSAIQDLQGNALEGPFSWGFKTGSENTGWVQLTRNFKDFQLDSDGDGVWDTLVVEVEISVLFTSTYNLSGWLLDKNGLAVARATTGNVALSGGSHLLSLYFSRQDIQNHGGEGPYYFADAFLYDVLYAGSGDSLTDPYPIQFTNYTMDANLLLFASLDPGVLEQNLTVYASVDNQGNSSVTGVVLTATLPPAVDFVSVVSGQGSCSHNAGTVTCNLGTLAGGQSNLVSIVVTPREKGWVQFNASVTSVQDSYVANNQQQLSLEITSNGKLIFLPLILKQ
ncbi:MAG: Ig-like domain-containing protein [Deltaproteobacteria bacterium]|nr:Ig-like domain-containing protein [Deltaproteobacteria bacterium]